MEEDLREAVCIGNEDRVVNYIKSGVNVNSQNSVNGWSALHWAAKRGYVNMVKLLMDAGAKPDMLTKDGKTPLHLSSNKEIHKLLAEVFYYFCLLPSCAQFMPIVEFIQNIKGNRRILHEGFVYLLDKRIRDKSYWRCEKRKECSSRMKTVCDVLRGQCSPHSHAPDPSRTVVVRTMSAIQNRAINSEESTSNVIQNCTQDFPLAASGSLPKVDTLAKMVRRKRKAPDGDDIPDELRRTTRGEEF